MNNLNFYKGTTNNLNSINNSSNFNISDGTVFYDTDANELLTSKKNDNGKIQLNPSHGIPVVYENGSREESTVDSRLYTINAKHDGILNLYSGLTINLVLEQDFVVGKNALGGLEYEGACLNIEGVSSTPQPILLRCGNNHTAGNATDYLYSLLTRKVPDESKQTADYSQITIAKAGDSLSLVFVANTGFNKGGTWVLFQRAVTTLDIVPAVTKVAHESNYSTVGLPIWCGGTGATTADDAREKLGIQELIDSLENNVTHLKHVCFMDSTSDDCTDTHDQQRANMFNQMWTSNKETTSTDGKMRNAQEHVYSYVHDKKGLQTWSDIKNNLESESNRNELNTIIRKILGIATIPTVLQFEVSDISSKKEDWILDTTTNNFVLTRDAMGAKNTDQILSVSVIIDPTQSNEIVDEYETRWNSIQSISVNDNQVVFQCLESFFTKQQTDGLKCKIMLLRQT